MSELSVMHALHTQVAEVLQPQFDFPLEIDGGWGIRIKVTPHANYFLCKMLFVNWRLIEVPAGGGDFCDRSWCYSGQNQNQALIAALSNIITWDGAEGTEPGGWIKSLPDGRRGPGRYGWDRDEQRPQDPDT